MNKAIHNYLKKNISRGKPTTSYLTKEISDYVLIAKIHVNLLVINSKMINIIKRCEGIRLQFTYLTQCLD